MAIVGGGFAGVTLTAALVRAAVDMRQTNLAITIFEPNTIGPGVAYDVDAPDAFMLNHELDFMGSLNVELDKTDAKDFYHWVQSNLAGLRERYKAYTLTDPKGYVPRSLFGRYLQARYRALKQYAAQHGISMFEIRYAVDDVRHHSDTTEFEVVFGDDRQVFDVVVLTTGVYFNQMNSALARTGKYFRPYDYSKYVSDDTPDGSVMLITGSALAAYDACIYALESGKYRKVIMASRRGMLRKVRGVTVPYVRQYVTIQHMEAMAGGPDKPFRLAHLLQAIRQELQHAHGQDVVWKDGYSVPEILGMLRRDIDAVRAGETLLWRSIHSSITDDERHEFYARLADADKREFVHTYSSLYQLFSAPMPLANADKLHGFILDGSLELMNGVQRVVYNEMRHGFELWCSDVLDDLALIEGESSANSQVGGHMYPELADVCIDAMGLGRAIDHLPLYRRLVDSGLVAAHPLGGIQTDMRSRIVTDASGNPVRGLYAIGHMACGETVLPHNSLQVSRACNTVGARILEDLYVTSLV